MRPLNQFKRKTPLSERKRDPFHLAYCHYMLLKVKIDLKVFDTEDEIIIAMKSCIVKMKDAQRYFKIKSKEIKVKEAAEANKQYNADH